MATSLLFKTGCGEGKFLGLEDYQRDLVVGGLAAALLAQQQMEAQQATDEEPEAPVAGRDGEDGLSCWDLNGNGTGDPDEDINDDGNFDALDCQGADGAGGAPGSAGAPGQAGQDGAPGLNCWDLNGNGRGDPAEDITGDGHFNALDCQGPPGPAGAPGAAGPAGAPGPPGADGPEYFDTFVDDFFTADEAPRGHLPVVLVSIEDPLLGLDVSNRGGGMTDAAAYRVAIPDTYVPATM